MTEAQLEALLGAIAIVAALHYGGEYILACRAAKQRRIRRRWHALFQRVSTVGPDAVDGAWEGLRHALAIKRDYVILKVTGLMVSGLYLVVRALYPAA